MNKKIGVLAALLLVFSATGAFSFGIGLQGGGGFSGSNFNGGGAVTFKLDSLPLIFAVSAGASANGFSLGLTGDYWLDNPTITGPLGWYYVVGAGVGIGGFDGNFSLNVNAHIPLGINVFLLDNKFEAFLQVAPGFGVGIIPFGFGFSFDGALGFRYYFS
jgi:hypothetical protein